MEDFRNILRRLAGEGWTPIFSLLGIDPDAPTLQQDLLEEVPLSAMALAQVPGFGDIAPTARRAIEPGSPARSILFHALASPDVTTSVDGTPLDAFPTAADLDVAENFVYGIMPRSLSSIIANIDNQANIACAVFAREYRQFSKTHHGMHADMVYSRTGVTRVGSQDALWDGPTRSYLPRAEGDSDFDFRVLPARYGVYIAVQAKGDARDFGPFKFNRGFDIGGQAVPAPDDEMDFWVPIHKLFSGDTCLLGHSLDVSLTAHHVNEKLRRIHDANMGEPRIGFESGFKPPQTADAPFVIQDGLADFLDPAIEGPGTLGAAARPRMIETTRIDGKRIGTRVPSDATNGLAPSFNIPAQGAAHEAPEWMHVRTMLRSDGTEDNLNERRNVAEIVREARVGNADNYVAGHYSDFTGDGWIGADIIGLPSHIDRMVPAYSLIAAPDFFPYVDQSELVDWWRTQVPTVLRDNIWAVPPLTLADQRSAANINLREYGADIRPENITPTAMVGSKGSASTQQALGATAPVPRVSSLPDAAAGIFAPGWDVSTDITFDAASGQQVLHLAAYGLGSPFPEDAKLCAALSAFWPGVAPDTARSAGRRVVAPLTDREVGHDGAPAWDGVLGPRRVTINNEDFFETDNFDHVDYVSDENSSLMTMAETMKVSQQHYQARVVRTARMYRLIGDLAQVGPDLSPVHRAFRILSFAQGRAGDAVVASAEAALNIQFDDMVCRYDVVRAGATAPLVNDPNNKARWLRREKILLDLQIVVGSRNRLAFRINNGPWTEPSAVG